VKWKSSCKEFFIALFEILNTNEEINLKILQIVKQNKKYNIKNIFYKNEF